MPYDKNGKFYTTRIGEDLKGDNALGRMEDRVSSARRGAAVGVRIGGHAGPVGATLGGTLGAISGFILGDQETIFPIDMIAIPAYQAFMIQGTPAFQIYIKEGEVLTQVIPTDAMEATEAVGDVDITRTPKKRKKSKYHTAYGKNFRKLAPKYKLKSGAWAKDGFKRCRDAAHKMTKKEMK
jgi:hypothetical protein